MFAEDWLSARAMVTPGNLALIQANRSWTYAELNCSVEQWSTRLSGFIQKGQHVGVYLPNRKDAVCLIHAFARIGAVLVPLNRRLSTFELNWQIEKANCQTVICSNHDRDKFQALENRNGSILVLEELKNESELGQQELRRLFSPDNLQAIVFTSGTTGRPKGAMLTFNNHFWSAAASAYRLGVKQNDRWLSCLPLYHVGGLAVIFRSCLYGTAVILHEGFDVAAVSESLDTQQVTLVSLVPTMVHRLLEYRQGRPWPAQLRHLLLGGDSAPLELLERCRNLKIPISSTYGLTEAASQVATAVPEQTIRKPGTCGQPLLFTTLKIKHETNQEPGPGE
ncbi:MAG: AMP-binding protein, partial [Candidatus Promineifilaceae bacterium]|nr:AMP-binding protein [Candidatus Promineifilaceae bacterium]